MNTTVYLLLVFFFFSSSSSSPPFLVLAQIDPIGTSSSSSSSSNGNNDFLDGLCPEDDQMVLRQHLYLEAQANQTVIGIGCGEISCSKQLGVVVCEWQDTGLPVCLCKSRHYACYGEQCRCNIGNFESVEHRHSDSDLSDVCVKRSRAIPGTPRGPKLSAEEITILVVSIFLSIFFICWVVLYIRERKHRRNMAMLAAFQADPDGLEDSYLDAEDAYRGADYEDEDEEEEGEERRGRSRTRSTHAPLKLYRGSVDAAVPIHAARSSSSPSPKQQQQQQRQEEEEERLARRRRASHETIELTSLRSADPLEEIELTEKSDSSN